MSDAGISRLDLLRGRWRGGPPPIRPPWALEEGAFRARCTGCGECVQACPEGILVEGAGKFPRVEFSRGECTFCRKCLEKCGDGALVEGVGERWGGHPWGVKAAIKPDCLALKGVTCRSCGDACTPGAIRFSLQAGGVFLPKIDIGQCNGCGACYPICPTKSVELSIQE